MTRGVPTAAITAILMFTLTACRNGEARGNKPLPPLSPSTGAQTSTSPSQSSPTKSTDAKADVLAFVDQYYAAANAAARTGDTKPWRALMTTDCNCQESAEYLDDQYADGSVRGLRFTVRKTSVQAVSRTDAQATVTYSVSAYDELASDGTVRKHVRSFAEVVDALTLKRVDGRLLMSRVTRAPVK
jgi:hypothetical protein